MNESEFFKNIFSFICLFQFFVLSLPKKIKSKII